MEQNIIVNSEFLTEKKNQKITAKTKKTIAPINIFALKVIIFLSK